MRCHICDAPLDEVEYDPRDGSICPCEKCKSVIEEMIYDNVIFDIMDEQKPVT